jgi:hypothetical protein
MKPYSGYLNSLAHCPRRPAWAIPKDARLTNHGLLASAAQDTSNTGASLFTKHNQAVLVDHAMICVLIPAPRLGIQRRAHTQPMVVKLV